MIYIYITFLNTNAIDDTPVSFIFVATVFVIGAMIFIFVNNLFLSNELLFNLIVKQPMKYILGK